MLDILIKVTGIIAITGMVAAGLVLLAIIIGAIIEDLYSDWRVKKYEKSRKSASKQP